MNGPPPPGQRAQRYQLPVRAPLRELVIACLSATVGSFEIFAWAIFGWPTFVVQAGAALILVGLGIAAWCLVRARAVRWLLYLDPKSLTIVRRSRRQELPWPEISAVTVVDSRLEIHRPGQRRPQRLPFSAGARDTRTFDEMLSAIEARLAARPEIPRGPG